MTARFRELLTAHSACEILEMTYFSDTRIPFNISPSSNLLLPKSVSTQRKGTTGEACGTSVCQVHACFLDEGPREPMPFFLKVRVFENFRINNTCRLFSKRQIEHSSTAHPPDVTKQLLRPADRVGCQQNII